MEIMTAAEACIFWDIHRTTLKRWIKKGGIQVVGRGKRNTLLFDKNHLVHFKPPTNHWLPWQVRKLITGYNIHGLFRKDLARKIGKSLQAVGSKAPRLGLQKYNQREFFFLKDVADFFGTNRHRAKNWIKTDKLKTKIIQSSGGRVRHRISEENIAEFMALFPGAWKNLKPHVNLLKLYPFSKMK